MADDVVKQYVRKAKRRAKQRCADLDYNIINSDNELFCFIASQSGIHERKIRIVIDKIDEKDIERIKEARILPSQTKEIWCWRRDRKVFSKLIFDHLNNLCQ